MKTASEMTETVANVAEKASDISKCVSVVSSTFQVLALSAKLAHTINEWKRSGEVFDWIGPKLRRLLAFLYENIRDFAKPHMKIDDVRLKFVFQSLDSFHTILADVEYYVMSSKIMQITNAYKLRQIESSVDGLRRDASIVANTKGICNLDARTTTLEGGSRVQAQLGVAEPESRPPISPYFVGRVDEREKVLVDVC